jgi:hypothetical protein
MCCMIAALFAFGPRAAILIWYVVEPLRWNQAFDSFLWALAGFLVAPWTTLMFVLVYPGGITGFDYVWIVIGIAFDVFSWSGGAYTNRDRIPMSRA